MARDHDGEPGRTVIGADVGEAFAAIGASIDLLEIGAEEMALPAIGAALQEAANHRLLRGVIGRECHGAKMVGAGLWKKPCHRRAAICQNPRKTWAVNELSENREPKSFWLKCLSGKDDFGKNPARRLPDRGRP